MTSTLPWPLVAVSVDGRTLSRPLAFDPGVHRVVFSADQDVFSFKPIPRNVTLAGAQTIDLAGRVPTGSFEFVVQVNETTLYLGDRPFQARTERVPNLPAGTYPIRIENLLGYERYVGEVEIQEGTHTLCRYSWGQTGWSANCEA